MAQGIANVASAIFGGIAEGAGMDEPEQRIARQPFLGLRQVLGGHRVRRRRPHRPGVGAGQAAAAGRPAASSNVPGGADSLTTACTAIDGSLFKGK